MPFPPPIPLLSFLMQGPPAIPLADARFLSTGHLTTSLHFGYEDINVILGWPEFNINTIMNQYGQLLRNTRILRDPMPMSPPKPVNSEAGVVCRIDKFFTDRFRRTLEKVFANVPQGPAVGITALTVDVGSAGHTIPHGAPDIAIFPSAAQFGDAVNRVPGEVKPSWKWNSRMRNSQSATLRNEYHQGLSQICFYMQQYRARYGFIITDEELVAVRRTAIRGQIHVSVPIRWNTSSHYNDPRLTVMLALWYLAMLGCQDNAWTI